jgi:hypothetical protein
MVKAPANYYYGVLWNKLYRRSSVEANRLRCDRRMAWCEDFLFITPPPWSTSSKPGSSPRCPGRCTTTASGRTAWVNTQTGLRRLIRTKKETFAAYKELYQKLDLYEEQKGRIYGYLALRRHRRSRCPPGGAPPARDPGNKKAPRRRDQSTRK